MRAHCVTEGVRGIVRRVRCADRTLIARWKLSPRLSLRGRKTGRPGPTTATRSIVEVKETEGFTRKVEDVREADFRLANRRPSAPRPTPSGAANPCPSAGN